VQALTYVGHNTSHHFDVLLQDGQYYFTCVAAINFAGLVTLTSSDGFAADTTPADVLWANDGFGGPDVDSASFLDAYFGNWKADDGGSGIDVVEFGLVRVDGDAISILRNASEQMSANVGSSRQWLNASFGEPRRNDSEQKSLTVEQQDHMVAVWASALQNISASDWVIRFEDTGKQLLGGDVAAASQSGIGDNLRSEPCCEDTGFQASFDIRGLRRGDRVAMVLRAWNHAGLVSLPYWTDGMTLGKNEMYPSETETTAMGLDMLCTSGDCDDDDAPATTGGLVVPPGAVMGPAGSKIEAGTVAEDEANDPDSDVIDPLSTPPPRNNLKFDGYSFTIKVKDSNGSEIEGFRFEKPIVLSFAYDVTALLDRLKSDNDASASQAPSTKDWAPALHLWDTTEERWIHARETCNPPWERIDFERQLYSVHLCHLTQFGMAYNQKPQAVALGVTKDALSAAILRPSTLISGKSSISAGQTY